MSIETCPPIERLYVVLQGEGLEAEQVADLASTHLASLGWRMDVRNGEWFDSSGLHPDSGDGSAYIGPLRDYMRDSRWMTDDRGTADLFQQLARDHRDDLAIVQIFAKDDDGGC